MAEAELLPVHALAGLGFAQVQQQAVAQLCQGQRRLGIPELEHGRRRRGAQQVEGSPRQRQGWVAVEEPHFAQRINPPAGHGQPVGKGQARSAVFQVRRQLGDGALEFERLRRFLAESQFEPGGVAPARQPVQQFKV